MQALMGLVLGARVVFGLVVSPVLGTCIPVITKMILGCPATEPPKSPIHHLGPAGDYTVEDGALEPAKVRSAKD
jgi:hypothetical protein